MSAPTQQGAGVSRRSVTLVGLLAALLIAAAAAVPWVSLPGTGALVDGGSVSVRGMDLVPVLIPLALVILAAVLAGLIVARVARIVCALALAAAGALTGFEMLRGLTDHAGLLTEWASSGAARTLSAERAAGASWGPFGPMIGLLGALAALAAAALLAMARWQIKRRFERAETVPASQSVGNGSAGSPVAGSATEPFDTPTTGAIHPAPTRTGEVHRPEPRGSAVGGAAAVPSPSAPTPTVRPAEASRDTAREGARVSDWDLLDRGEDPTVALDDERAGRPDRLD